MIFKIFNFYRALLADAGAWIKRVAIIFALGFVFGIGVAYINPGFLAPVLAGLVEELGIDKGLTLEVAFNIFWHNLFAFFLVSLGGIIFGIGAVAIALLNGFIVGHVLALPFFYSINGHGQTILFMVAALVPHGVLELPAFIVSGAFSLRMGLRWMLPSSMGARRQVFRDDFVSVIRLVPLIVFVLLVAALLEVFVSGSLVALLLE